MLTEGSDISLTFKVRRALASNFERKALKLTIIATELGYCLHLRE